MFGKFCEDIVFCDLVGKFGIKDTLEPSTIFIQKFQDMGGRSRHVYRTDMNR